MANKKKGRKRQKKVRQGKGRVRARVRPEEPRLVIAPNADGLRVPRRYSVLFFVIAAMILTGLYFSLKKIVQLNTHQVTGMMGDTLQLRKELFAQQYPLGYKVLAIDKKHKVVLSDKDTLPADLKIPWSRINLQSGTPKEKKDNPYATHIRIPSVTYQTAAINDATIYNLFSAEKGKTSDILRLGDKVLRMEVLDVYEDLTILLFGMVPTEKSPRK